MTVAVASYRAHLVIPKWSIKLPLGHSRYSPHQLFYQVVRNVKMASPRDHSLRIFLSEQKRKFLDDVRSANNSAQDWIVVMGNEAGGPCVRIPW